ncbi:MAG TPA: hypothetical protein VFQ80_14765 [Thermomicrobiales bacterium]|nr:hypothetical protein [Thermomicrobiales bacterium]
MVFEIVGIFTACSGEQDRIVADRVDLAEIQDRVAAMRRDYSEVSVNHPMVGDFAVAAVDKNGGQKGFDRPRRSDIDEHARARKIERVAVRREDLAVEVERGGRSGDSRRVDPGRGEQPVAAEKKLIEGFEVKDRRVVRCRLHRGIDDIIGHGRLRGNAGGRA